MRNETTDRVGIELTASQIMRHMTVNEFINHMIAYHGAFDITRPQELYGDTYAGFHMIYEGGVLSAYYWGKREEWFATY